MQSYPRQQYIQHKFYNAIMLDTGYHPRYNYYTEYFKRSLLLISSYNYLFFKDL
jgi:hypothetical protein